MLTQKRKPQEKFGIDKLIRRLIKHKCVHKTNNIISNDQLTNWQETCLIIFHIMQLASIINYKNTEFPLKKLKINLVLIN